MKCLKKSCHTDEQHVRCMIIYIKQQNSKFVTKRIIANKLLWYTALCVIITTYIPKVWYVWNHNFMESECTSRCFSNRDDKPSVNDVWTMPGTFDQLNMMKHWPMKTLVYNVIYDIQSAKQMTNLMFMIKNALPPHTHTYLKWLT